jgi:hypothetical protein
MTGMVRALGGTSTLVAVADRLTIGRAPDNDLQLLDPHVSRRHARIERDDSGAAVLVDLSSTSGTRVGDRRITRHVLCDGDLIRLANVTLRWEEAGEPPRTPRPTVDRGIRALRPTLRLELAGEPALVLPDRLVAPVETVVVSPPPVTTRSERSSSTGITLAPPGLAVAEPAAPRGRAGTRAKPARRWTPSGIESVPAANGGTGQFGPIVDDDDVSFDDAFLDGQDFVPDAAMCRGLIRDVFDYRMLRMRSVRGEMLPEDAVERLRALDERMHRHSVTQRALDHLRRYHRFACEVPGWLGSLSGRAVSTLAVDLKDVGAGGAQVRCPEGRFQVGDPCWLVVDLETDDHDPLVVFRARVAWSTAGASRMGLAFSGAARRGPDALELIRADA